MAFGYNGNPYLNSYSNPYQQYQQPIFQQTQQTTQGQQTQQTVQQGGFVRVQNEQEARQYPLAPGYSMTFIDDSGNYCYVKTMGFSQLDKPRFEKYRLVREDSETPTEQKSNAPEYVLKSDFDELAIRVDELQKIVDAKKKVRKKESEVEEE